MKTVEELAEELSTPAWLFAAAKQKFRWVTGKQIDKDVYLAALAATEKHTAAS